MQAYFLSSAQRILGDGAVAARARGIVGPDYRAALCCWEDDLFARYPEGHRILTLAAATSLIAIVFEACGKTPPLLHFVPGFEDPRVGGFADIAGYRILLEDGCLYRYLILHECTHLLVPSDRLHGPIFTYVLQALYRSFVGIPEAAIRESLLRHGLPSHTELPADSVAAAA